MRIPLGSRQGDTEKRDRAMAKAVLDKLGMEPEKYRLGYTKVGHQNALSSTQLKLQIKTLDNVSAVFQKLGPTVESFNYFLTLDLLQVPV